MRTLRPAILIAGLWLMSCSATTPSNTVLHERVAGHHLVVKLETVGAEGEPAFAHPVVGEEAELARGIEGLLAELSYGRPKAKRLYRVMPSADRERLALGLARGLTSASPSERVIFVLAVDEGDDALWFAPDQQTTRGVAFVDHEGRFNLAFDAIEDRLEPDNPEPYDPTQRAQTRVRLVSQTGEDIGATAQGKRRLWVAWPSLPGARSPATPPSTADASPVEARPEAAKLELLDELLRDGVIDADEYERRRAKLGAPNP